MNEQLSFSLSDEVAPYFDSPYIATLCHLIDEKQTTGKKYGDLKERLVKALESEHNILLAPSQEIYNRAYEFSRYF